MNVKTFICKNIKEEERLSLYLTLSAYVVTQKDKSVLPIHYLSLDNVEIVHTFTELQDQLFDEAWQNFIHFKTKI